jgi:uncharacterized protein YbaP (TraB family)
MMRRFCEHGLTLGLSLLLLGPAVVSADQSCRPLELLEPAERTPVEHTQGLLWRVSDAAGGESFVFGTIHLGDADVVSLPAPIQGAFDSSEAFVMEALLDARAAMAFSQRMFYTSGEQLSDSITPELFQRVASLLAGYGVPEPMARNIKPWAAYLTLSFPPGAGQLPLDMVLMESAYQQHKAVHGLESIDEQAAIFERMAVSDQIALLVDLVCNYDVVQGDIEAMKDAYLARDLGGLVQLSEKYTLGSDDIYQRLIKVLLTDRNHRMVERMSAYVEAGNAFIAVGALHLPGPEGILQLLKKRGYRIEAVY